MDKQGDKLPTDQLHRNNAFVRQEKPGALQMTKKKVIKLDSLMPNIANPFSTLIQKPPP
jgi:hypothetical protein